MSTCERCGVELELYTCSRTDETKPLPHRPSQCFTNLRSQLAARDAELAVACENLRSENLRAEDYRRKYEAARATIEGLREALVRAENVLSDIGDAEGPTRDGERMNLHLAETWAANALPLIRAALAATGEAYVRKICPCETLAEEPGPHIPECPYSDPDYEPAAQGKTSERRGNIHGKPPPEPADDADGTVLHWLVDYATHDPRRDVVSLAALIRSERAAAKRQGVREGWEGASKRLRECQEGTVTWMQDMQAAADWLDARKPEVG